MKYFPWIILSCYSGLISELHAATVENIYINDNVPAVKGSDIQIVCGISQFSTSSLVDIYRSDTSLPPSLAGISPLTQCVASICPTQVIDRYAFSADSSKIYINITSLQRREDAKYWACSSGNQRKQLHLTIYTITQTLQYDNPPSQDQDLAQTSMTLKCSTGCAYPSPSFTWYFIESEGSRKEWSTSESGTDKADGCTDLERIYTSTLTLAKYTVFSNNTDKTVKFQCGAMSITGITDRLFTSSSVNIRFAVRVTSVTLKYNNTTPPSTLEVTRGVSITLTCTTSASRPSATLIWFIGTEEKKRSTGSTSSLTFTPDNSDHGHHVYCKAFNLQTENQAVISNKPSLSVKEPTVVKSFYIGERNSQPNVTVDEHDVTQFTCEVSGDPASNVQITFKGKILTEQADTNELTFTYPDVDCFHSGIYTCEGNDSNGRTSSMSSTLLVKCLPVVDTAPCKCDKESTALLIVAVIVGIISVVLAAYATGITILYKRKTKGNGKRYSDRSTSQTTYVNTVYKPNDKKEQETTQRREITHNASGTNEDSLLQYTDLTAYSRDDKTTYDIIKTE